jgi:hypothetical protein
MPALGDLHIDQALTNLTVMYRNENYIADDVLPPLPVSKRSAKYFVYKKEDFLSSSPNDANNRPMSLRSMGAEAAEIDMSMSNSNYYAEEYAYRGLVTDAEVAIADSPLQPDADQAVQLTERLLLDNESVVAAITLGINNYNTANKKLLVAATGTNKGDASWNINNANTSPLTNIKNARVQIIAGIAKDANVIIMGYDSALTLAETQELKTLLQYTNPDMVSGSGLPKTIRGMRTVVGMAQRNFAGEGQPYQGGYIWDATDGAGNYYGAALVAYVAPAPGLRMTSLGYTFKAPDDTTGSRDISVRRWREEKRKGDLIEAAFLRDWRFIGVDGSTNGWQGAGYATAGSLIYGTTL